MAGWLLLGIRLRFHNQAPQQLAIRLAFHQQAADELRGNHLSGAGEEALGEGWEGLGGYGSGLGECSNLIQRLIFQCSLPQQEKRMNLTRVLPTLAKLRKATPRNYIQVDNAATRINQKGRRLYPESAIAAPFIVAAIAYLAPPSIALPFNSNAQSFQNYVNQLNWGGEANINFQNLYSCSKSKYIQPNWDSPRSKEAQRQRDAWESTRDNFRFDGEQHNASTTGCGSCDPSRRDVQEYDKIIQNRDEWGKLVGIYANQDGHTIETFSCSGYVRVNDPRGTRVCKASVNYNGSSGASYSGRECVWK